MVNVEIKGNLKFPKEFVSQTDLLYIARSLFIPLLVQNIEDQMPITGGSYPPLEPSTIKSKIKTAIRSPSMALINTGRLLRSFRANKIDKNSVQIDIASDRANIGYYLQEEGVGKKNKHFNFFGISQGMEAEAMDYLKQKIGKVVSNFNGG